jgi:hypothetical protein
MSKVDFIHCTACVNPIYSLFDNDEVKAILSNCSIEKTIWRDDIKSERSLCLKTDNPKDPSDIIATFDLNPQSFEEKFKKAAIEGDGQEFRRIRTLHSSSLICLLCFYGISEQKPLYLNLDGHDIKFTESLFEVKNPIGNHEEGKPSNIDVVLSGKDIITGKKAVLFLESKFSEYLSWGKHSKISDQVYGNTYKELINGGTLERMKLKYGPMKDEQLYYELTSNKGRTYHYAGGIKQMISHFLGVKTVSGNAEYTDCDIYLGEILFKFEDSIDAKQRKFNDYAELYKILSEGLNTISESRFKVVSQILTYQEVFRDYELDNAVRTFYSL